MAVRGQAARRRSAPPLEQEHRGREKPVVERGVNDDLDQRTEEEAVTFVYGGENVTTTDGAAVDPVGSELAEEFASKISSIIGCSGKEEMKLWAVGSNGRTTGQPNAGCVVTSAYWILDVDQKAPNRKESSHNFSFVVRCCGLVGSPMSMPSFEMKQHVTNLHFFFHDIAGGDNPTVVLVAAPKSLISLVKEPSFGSVYAIDDPLTEGSEGDSTTIVGSAQGFYISSGQTAPMLVFAANFGFTTGPYNGSSFSVFSRNPVMDTDRELAVVGGRGASPNSELTPSTTPRAMPSLSTT
ncbi:hypothetical protein GW17_00026723 [Ensete ventricosum]|nr:hypothetical protein GW17_00026723 [Ensete ventricosum]